MRNVNSDGSLNNNNANNGNSAAADCEHSEHIVRTELPGTRPEIKALTHRERQTFSGNGGIDAGGRRRDTSRSCYSPRRFLREGSAISDYEKATDFGTLYRGFRKSKRNVMWKDSVASYSVDALKNTLKLKREIENGTYRLSPYQRFMVHEPKTREIVATRFRDRQFQRALCDTSVYEQMTKGFIYDNCACQIGKGVDFALNRLETHLHRYYRKHGNAGWVLKCDIRHYFPDTPHDTAKAAVRKRIRDDRIYREIAEIIDSFGGDRGIGLGSQVSQLIELAVLDGIDHYIKERLRIRHYIRYMDDMILIHEDRKVLENALGEIRRMVEALGLEMNKKTQIFPLRQGIIFLKWRYILTESGKVIRKIGRRSTARERRRIKKLAGKVISGEYPEERMWLSFQSWRANAQRGNARQAIRSMERLYEKLKGEIEYGSQTGFGTEGCQGNGTGGSRSGTLRKAGGAAGTEDRAG